MFWTFPNDRRIADAAAAGRRLAGARDLLGRPRARTRLVAYAPERAATAALPRRRGGVLAYAKVQPATAPSASARTRGAAPALGRDRRLRVPRVLAASRAARSCSSRCPAAGSTSCRRRRWSGRCARSAPRSRRCTRRRPPPARASTRLDAARLAHGRGRDRAARGPDAAARRGAAARALLDARRATGAGACSLHGDANLRNALARRRRRRADRLRGRRPPARPRPTSGTCSPAARRARAGPHHRGRRARARRRAARRLRGGRRAAGRAALRWHTAASVLARVALPAVSRVRRAALARLRRRCSTPRGRSSSREPPGAALLLPALGRARPPDALVRAVRARSPSASASCSCAAARSRAGSAPPRRRRGRRAAAARRRRRRALRQPRPAAHRRARVGGAARADPRDVARRCARPPCSSSCSRSGARSSPASSCRCSRRRAQPGALTACSLRDILVSRRADQRAHDERACALAERAPRRGARALRPRASPGSRRRSRRARRCACRSTTPASSCRPRPAPAAARGASSCPPAAGCVGGPLLRAAAAARRRPRPACRCG